ncbi:hypothetical protein HCUR_00666 [Holospora curviuscula]|uniref:Uncharacterized protein n=1 Tax=Holospora curviuscula TaxID=1082868 RepID=A0A2S5R987_9PROT|nr:hypothetical protein HCUR_00666 [Holospora curviuscula]
MLCLDCFRYMMRKSTLINGSTLFFSCLTHHIFGTIQIFFQDPLSNNLRFFYRTPKTLPSLCLIGIRIYRVISYSKHSMLIVLAGLERTNFGSKRAFPLSSAYPLQNVYQSSHSSSLLSS